MPGTVHFRGDPVQSLSRSLHQRELDLLQDFEDHVLRNIECYRHLDASPLPQGCKFCRDATAYIMSRFEFRLGKCVQKPWRQHCPMIVEIPWFFKGTRRTLIKRAKSDRDRARSRSRQSKVLFEARPRSGHADSSSPQGSCYISLDTCRPQNTRHRSTEREVSVQRNDDCLSFVFRRLVVAVRDEQFRLSSQ